MRRPPVAELRQVGLRLEVPRDRGQRQRCLEAAAASLAEQVATFRASRFAVCIDLSAAARSAGGLRPVSEALVRAFPAALEGRDCGPTGLAFSCSSIDTEIDDVVEFRRCAALGRPRFFLRVPDAQIAAGRARTPGARNARERWRRQTALAFADPGTSIILESTTRPACDLSVAERPETVLPVSRFETAAATAWLTLQIDLARIASLDHGRRPGEIRRLLRAGLRDADNRLDHCDWGADALRADAMLYRRLAIHVIGVGDLVDRCGWQPSEFVTIRAVSRRLRLLRRMLVRESVALARRRGPFPGLLAGGFRERLGLRFGDRMACELIYRRALRHRHLLAISPWALFPRGRPACALREYLHLLPALRAADTVAMYRPRMRQGPGLDDFRLMLGLSWAEARNR